MTIPANHDRLLRLSGVKAMIGLQTTAIYSLISRGDFPKPIKLGRVSVWPESEVMAWIEARKAERRAA